MYKDGTSRIRPATAWVLHICVWSRARSGLGEEVSLALGCVTSFHSVTVSENRRFRSARGGSREGGRAFEGAHGKDTDRGGGRSSHLPPPRERPTGGGVRSTSGADHRPAGGSPRSRGGGYKVTLVLVHLARALEEVPLSTVITPPPRLSSSLLASCGSCRQTAAVSCTSTVCRSTRAPWASGWRAGDAALSDACRMESGRG